MTEDTRRRDPFHDLDDDLRSTVFWWLLGRGVLAVLVGLVLFSAPGVGALAITVIIGVWLVLDGVTGIAIALQRKRSGDRWGKALAGGIVAVLTGLAALVFPYAAAMVGGLAVLWILAAGLAARGIFEISDRRSGAWGTARGAISAFVAVLLAIVMIGNPVIALGALVIVVGIYGVVFGLFTIASAVRVRRG